MNDFNAAVEAGEIQLSLAHLLNDLYTRAVKNLQIDGLVITSGNYLKVPDLETLKIQVSDLLKQSATWPNRKNLRFGTEIIQAIYSAKLALTEAMEGVKTASDKRALLVIYGMIMGQMMAFSQIGENGHVERYNELVSKLYPAGKSGGGTARSEQLKAIAEEWKSLAEPKIVALSKRSHIVSRQGLINLLRKDSNKDFVQILPGDDSIRRFMETLEEANKIRSFARKK